ncbi:alpha/beta-hydrolase [Mycena pura]|uniref:Alpha/beta-hydrolase n=1 Tax=Mycena pura TaxID=153505 RepID=A0AAD6UYW2_9AGAR|nr:alpha/beta-hydrolase [Mycena pura]
MTPAAVSKLCPSTDGTLIYAEASGNPANPSVVFVHGFALSGIVFDKLFCDVRMLEKLYLVRYDARGHGRSGKPSKAAGYASSLYAADFAAVVKTFSLNQPVYVGWVASGSFDYRSAAASRLALIISDICTYISPVPLSGAIAMSGALCPMTADKTLRPRILDIVRKFHSPYDAMTALDVRAEFIDAVFKDPGSVPFNDKVAWMGCTIAYTPEVTRATMAGHKPNQTKLTELGLQGFPAMILYGSEDKIQDGRVAVGEARAYFTDLVDAPIEGGSHCVFYDDLDETVRRILSFCLRVSGQTYIHERIRNWGLRLAFGIE